MAISRGPRVVTNGLALLVDAADRNSYPSSGILWNDLSGNRNNGTLTNGPIFSSSNGGSIVLDGIDDSVDLGTGASLTSLTNNITVEAWIKTSDPSIRQTIYGNGYAGTGLMFGIAGGDPNGLEVYYPTVFVASARTAVLQANVWQQVAYTRNGSGTGTHSLYVDGLSQTVTGTANEGDSWGASGTNRYLGLRSGLMFSGSIGLARVYSRALTATEISQNFNAMRKRFGV